MRVRPLALLLAISTGELSYANATHVWPTGKIVDYDMPAPFDGHITNGRFSPFIWLARAIEKGIRWPRSCSPTFGPLKL